MQQLIKHFINKEENSWISDIRKSEMTLDNPPGATGGKDELQLESTVAKDNTITDLLLGVVNWWCLKGGKIEVVNLILRHFEHDEVYKSSL